VQFLFHRFVNDELLSVRFRSLEIVYLK
jgi:hypothetical protein